MITMLELLEKIKSDSQPSSIVYNDEYYYWTYENEEGFLESNYVTVDRNKLQVNSKNSIGEIIYKRVIDSEPLITRKERDYLKTVISPFHDRIKSILKTCPSRKEGGREAIVIVYTGDDITESVCQLPTFEYNSSFKGMELWKNYQLSDLHIHFNSNKYEDEDLDDEDEFDDDDEEE